MAVGAAIEAVDFSKFDDVVAASRRKDPGLGVIAINTAAGAVEASAKAMFGKRTSALPWIVAREDVPIQLALISSHEQTIAELQRGGVRCVAQAAAARQSYDLLKEQFPRMRIRDNGPESTRCIRTVVERGDRNFLTIGPAHAAEPMGGFIVEGQERVSPEGNVTSFYVLQRDPREQILPADADKSENLTVLAIAYPEGEGELAKCLEVAETIGLEAVRYMPYNPRDSTRHNPNLKRDGGILEVRGGYFDEHITEFCAQVNQLQAIDGADGPFNGKRLGQYQWYPGDVIDLQALAT